MAGMMVVLALNAQSTKMTVKKEDLPKAITEHISQNYSGYMIKGATKVTEDKMITYDVMIHKGSSMETLVFDKDGKFLRTMKPEPTASMSNTSMKRHEKSSPNKK